MKPHIYRWDGRWWVSRNGHDSFRKGITMNDLWSVTFDLAVDTADMAWWKAHGRSVSSEGERVDD